MLTSYIARVLSKQEAQTTPRVRRWPGRQVQGHEQGQGGRRCGYSLLLFLSEVVAVVVVMLMPFMFSLLWLLLSLTIGFE